MKKNFTLFLALVASVGTMFAESVQFEDYHSPINVYDNSIDDWDALDPSKVAVSTVTADPYFPALKQIKVYSDGVYINYLLEYVSTEYTSHEGDKDGMHI